LESVILFESAKNGMYMWNFAFSAKVGILRRIQPY